MQKSQTDILMPFTHWTVHKFGGNSLKEATAYQQAASLLSGEGEIIIVSAAAKTTDLLQALLDKAFNKQAFNSALQELEAFQRQLITDLLKDSTTQLNLLKQNCQEIQAILEGVKLVGDYQTVTRDRILSYGELWSAQLMSAYLNATCLDASLVLFIEWQHGIVNIDWLRSQQTLEKFLTNNDFKQLVITGFIASTPEGKKATLGKNGSDFSAAIFAKLFNAKEMIKWTDVDGVHSADPRKVKSAFPIKHLSYEEALELAYFGANIIHPRAIYPVIEQEIPVRIKNVNNPSFAGTAISQSVKHDNPPPVCGLTSIDHVALINIEGAGIIGVSGVAARVFAKMHEVDISVILISQSSSEHSICFAILDYQAEKAVKELSQHFAYEIQQHRIENISAEKGCAILAAVGDNMVGTIGVASKLFSMLARANINIRAISQGSSERNISVVIKNNDITRALRAVHGGFYLSNKTISIGLIGPGGVGKALLDQIQANLKNLSIQYKIDLRLRGIMRSTQMALADKKLDPTTWESNTIKADLNEFINHIAAEDIPNAVLIDCTSSQEIANQYPKFIAQGLHIVTPNKKTNSGDLTHYQNVKHALKKYNRHYLYETTVCAGLPTIKTLQDLIATGDTIFTIEGIVSGTLAYIFDELAKGDRFSEVVLRAHAKGYTEPDPRDDLTGMDVARKFVCLARELSFNKEISDVKVFNLVPQALSKVSTKEFLQKLPEFDDEIHQSLQPKANEKLCYVGSINQEGEIMVSVQGYGQNHPFYNLKGTDNILSFTTQRYQEYPLVIQGPGAGTEVTAAGVFADLLRLLSFL